MSERYSRLYTLPVNLYLEGAPIFIAAGALLKDNQSGKVLAQLKLRNINVKKIKAVTVRILMRDVAGKELGEPVEYQYLDVNVARGEEFAQKVPVFLPDNTARGMDVSAIRVIFNDNSEWVAEEGTWKSFTNPKTLESAFADEELVKEYKLKYGASCEYLQSEERGLWYCSCGALNYKVEKDCHRCRQSLETLLAVDLDALREQKAERLSKEAEAAAKALEEEKAKERKNRTIGIIFTVIALIAIGILAIIATKPARVMKEAREISESGDYMAAVALLDDFGESEKTASDRQEYIDAMEDEIQDAISNKKYATAMELIEKYTVLETAQKNITYIQGCCNHQMEDIENVAVTCIADGFVRNKCTVCDCEKTTIYPARGHTFISELAKRSTCTEHGQEVLTCSVCNEVETKELELLPHDFKINVINPPTCTERGINRDICAVCGLEKPEDILVAALEHDYVKSVVSSAGCVTEGQIKYTCSRCSDSYTETLEATGHSFSQATCTSGSVCSRCGVSNSGALGHTTTTGKCTRCGYNFTPPIVISGYYQSPYYFNDSYEGVINIPKGEYLVTVTTEMSNWTVGITNEGMIAFGSGNGSTQFTSRWDISNGGLSFKAIDRGNYTITITPVN